jgi:protoheme IX farnesyltransferase
VIGWAAATGEAPWQAWLLFLIIFLWTPPHSWALALYSAGDYARAGIPMMPVARGAKSTRLQILVYSLVFVPVAVAPGFVGLGGPLYLAVSISGGLAFLFLAVRLWRSRAGDQPDKAEAVGREAALYDVRAEAKPARNLFAFSILYLMALFAALLVVVAHRIVQRLALIAGQLQAGAHAIRAPTVFAVVGKQTRVELGIRGVALRAGASGGIGF